MSHLDNVPADLLVGTVEKLVAKMDEGDLAAVYERDLASMPPEPFAAFIEAIFDAFRGRGESSEDAMEAAGTTHDRVNAQEPEAVAAFVHYARENSGLLKEATTTFVEERPDFVSALPQTLRDAIAQRLTHVS
jgi:ABC-type transporter Mla subunit MlaD